MSPAPVAEGAGDASSAAGRVRPGGHAGPGRGRSAPDACSVRFDARDLSAYGTAAVARFWLAVEQAGPWGRAAATESHLPVDVGRRLDTACTERGGRLALLRAPGPHPDTHHTAGRTAYLAFAGDEPWLLVVRDTTLAELESADLDALAAGDRDGVRASLPRAVDGEPVLLVCTNGRRDVCCAVRGRPVAVEAAAARPGLVWESSHTGGHRFAPTGVLLPHGATLARLDAGLCAAVLDEAREGHLPPAALGPRHDRGRSPLAAAAAAAESFVRARTGETGLAALRTRVAARADDAPGTAVCEVERVRDGHRWRVEATRAATGDDLPESCGKAPVPLAQWALRLL